MIWNIRGVKMTSCCKIRLVTGYNSFFMWQRLYRKIEKNGWFCTKIEFYYTLKDIIRTSILPILFLCKSIDER